MSQLLKHKRFISFIFLLMLLTGLLAVITYLGLTAPLHPGQAFYGWQHAGEQAQLHLTPEGPAQTSLALRLADRRLASLAQAHSPNATQQAVQALEQALATAVTRLNTLPTNEQPTYTTQFQALLQRSQIVLTALEPDDAVTALVQQVAAWQTMDTAAEIVAHLSEQAATPHLRTAVFVPFLAEEVDHAAFPLSAGHANLPCESCHTDGQYAHTTTVCADCHPAQPAVNAANLLFPSSSDVWETYPDHFAGDCQDCHNTTTWQPYQFDHEGIRDCLSCHAHDEPEPLLPEIIYINFMETAVSPTHYPGECQLCHTVTTNWNLFAYDHALSNECASCHIQDTPAIHYPGACTLCHADTEDWSEFTFDHADVDECESCHAQEEPELHWPELCTQCHQDVTDWTILQVNHIGLTNCQTCHQAETPQPHYEGSCQSCHNTADWLSTTFDHTHYQDCQSCHTSAQNVNHYYGQCSSCHQETTWQNVTFDHTGQTDCTSCHSEKLPDNHYPGYCGSCHLTTAWQQVWITHEGFSQCASCHRAPISHFSGSCSNCHNTQRWSDATFSHIGLTDCQSCHNQQAPTAHYSGQCSKCHTTNSWLEITFSHAGATDCQTCHATPAEHWPGPCATCHTTTEWPVGSIDHATFTECTTCHAPPSGHWPGQCSSCHNTNSWSEVKFDHTGYTDCKACHARPADHGRGQCSRCHTTDSWSIVATPTAVPQPTHTPNP